MKLTLKAIAFAILTLNLIPLAQAEEIKLNKMGDMYTLPMRINDALTMTFLLDTGAADVGFPDSAIDRMIGAGFIDQRDIKGTATYTLADGSAIKCRRLILRKVHIGNREIKNIEASSCPGQAPLLLGQSVLKKLGGAIDYGKNALVVADRGVKVAETPTYTKKDIAYYEEAESDKDPTALYSLSLAYFWGNGVQKDLKKAFTLMKESADTGYAPAQFGLGLMYYDGHGVPKNYAKAVEWYTKAAEQGDADAQNNLGFMYAEGKGVPQNYAKALELYRKAAEQGFAKAQYNLGGMYYKGISVPQDYAKALELYRKAAEQGLAEAQNNLGLMYYEGKGVSQNYAKAVEWYTKAAEQGNAWAQYYLGLMYAKGHGVSQDYTRVLDLSAAQGHAQAQRGLEVRNFRFAAGSPTAVRSPALFQPGEKLFIVFEVFGYKSEKNLAWIQEDLIVRYPDGSFALHLKNINEFKQELTKVGPIRFENNIAIPEGSQAGRYTVIINLRDILSGKTTSAQHYFNINGVSVAKDPK